MTPKNVKDPKTVVLAQNHRSTSQGPGSGSSRPLSSSSTPLPKATDETKALPRVAKELRASAEAAAKRGESGAAKWLEFFGKAPNQYEAPSFKPGSHAKDLKKKDQTGVPSPSVQAVEIKQLDFDNTKTAVDRWCEKGLYILKNPKVQEEMQKWPAPPRKMDCIQMRSEGDVKLVTYRDIGLPIVQMLRAYHAHTLKAEEADRGSINMQAEYGLYGVNTKNLEVSGTLDFAMVLSNNKYFTQPDGPERPFLGWEVKQLGHFGKLIAKDDNSTTGRVFIEGAATEARLQHVLKQVLHYCILSHVSDGLATDGKNFIVAHCEENHTYKLDFAKDVGTKSVKFVTTFPRRVNVTIVPYDEGALTAILGFCWEALVEEKQFNHRPISEDTELRDLLLKISTSAAQDAKGEQKRKRDEKARKALEKQDEQKDTAGPPPRIVVENVSE